MNLSVFTPVQRKMYRILEDGMPHDPRDLLACLSDELAEYRTIHVHLTGMRKYLRSVGQDISLTQVNGTKTYTLVRRIPPSSRE